MGVFALAPLLATIVNLALGIFVFTRNPRANLNKVFFLFALTLSIWNGGIFLMFWTDSASEALTIARALHFGVIFSPYLFIHIAFLILKIPIRRIYYLVYTLPVVFSLTNLTDWFIRDVTHLSYSWYGIGGPAFSVFMAIYLLITLLFIGLAIHKRKDAQHFDKTKINYLLLAKSILLVFGFHDSLPILSIYQYPIVGGTVYPLFTIGSTIYGLLIGYSVLQHQILDIYTSLGRIAATLTRILFLLFFYSLLILVLGLFFPNDFTFTAVLGSLAAFLTSVLMGSIFFPKLIGFGEEVLEKRLLGDRFEHQDRARHFISQIPFYPSERDLLTDLRPILLEAFGIENYFIFVYQKDSDSYVLLESNPLPGTRIPDCYLTRDSYIAKHFSGVKDRSNNLANRKDLLNLWNLNDEERNGIVNLEAKLCFPLRSGEDLLGFLMIGENTRSRPFTAVDVELFQSMAANLGLFIAQADLKRQVADAHELELLGNLSRGLAHDLNNLITPIYTYCQLSEESHTETDSLRDFGRLAKRNLVTMQSYIKESLFFSTNQEPKLSRVQVLDTLSDAVALHKPTMVERNITIRQSCPEDLETTLDDVLVQRLLSNLLRNAVDASREGGSIEISVTCLSRVFYHRKWVRFTVQDHGIGIPDDEQDKVFTPYFTTKDTGDTPRGSGLGLSICRRIVDLHQGKISIYSKVNVGTRVEVDLPSTLLPTSNMSLSEVIPA